MIPQKVIVFITFLTLAEGYLYQLSHPQHDTEVPNIATIPLRTSKAFSVVHCNLICVNTNECLKTMYKDEKCTLLKKNHYGKQQRGQLKTKGAISSQIEKPCSVNPCFNGGKCISFYNDFRCVCPNSTTGLICETRVTGKSCLDIKMKYPGSTSKVYDIKTKDYYEPPTKPVYCDMNNVSTIHYSCSSIKDQYSAVSSGNYNIYSSIKGIEQMSVYCDMTTDGGGWMQVLNARHNATLTYVNKLENFVAAGNYYMTKNALNELSMLEDIRQIRFRCSSMEVLLHIKTNPKSATGKAVVKLLSGNQDVGRPKFCGSFAALPDDTSAVADDCQEITMWTDLLGAQGMYATAIWGVGDENGFYCRSQSESQGLNDFWEVFVR